MVASLYMAEAGLLAGPELVVRLVLVLVHVLQEVRSQGRRKWMRKIGVDHNSIAVFLRQLCPISAVKVRYVMIHPNFLLPSLASPRVHHLQQHQHLSQHQSHHSFQLSQLSQQPCHSHIKSHDCCHPCRLTLPMYHYLLCP